MVKILTADTFSDTIKNATVPVLVDFYADWCGPCKMMAPIIDEISSEMDGKIDFCKINVDEAESIALSLGIDSIPTIMVFKDGEAVLRSVGLLPKDALSEKLEALL